MQIVTPSFRNFYQISVYPNPVATLELHSHRYITKVFVTLYRLILQLWAWAGAENGSAREQPDEAEWETRRMLDELCALHATRYYFARVELIPSQVSVRRLLKL